MSRNAGDTCASGWIAEHTSCLNPGSVSSSVRVPPPIAAFASNTSTSNPARASTTAAVRPFGPEPMTTARRLSCETTPRAATAPLAMPHRGQAGFARLTV